MEGTHFAQCDESALRGGMQRVSDRKRRLDMAFPVARNERLELRAATANAGPAARYAANWSIRSVIPGLRGDYDSGAPDGSKSPVIPAAYGDTGGCGEYRGGTLGIIGCAGEMSYRDFAWAGSGIVAGSPRRDLAVAQNLRNALKIKAVWREGAKAPGAVLCGR
jgi:hypothetical protein